MISHILNIEGEDVSRFLVSFHMDRTGGIDWSEATANITLANVYGMFTGRWKDDTTARVRVTLINERHNCMGLSDIREPGNQEITIESNAKTYRAFCGYISKADYDERFVKLTCRTDMDFLEQEPMPDGVRPRGGTAYIATPPAELILDVIAQHKDPAIGVAILSPAEAATRGYPLLQIQRKNLPGYTPPVPPGGNEAVYPPTYDYLSPTEYAKSFPNNDGDLAGWQPGNGLHGDGYYRKPGWKPGDLTTKARTCTQSCRYKVPLQCCKSTECAYKKKGTLCRQVKCPYEVEKRGICFTTCPYDTHDCPDSVTTAAPFECSSCSGSGSSSTGGTCAMCGGTGYSNNAASNAAIVNAQSRVSKADQAVKEAQKYLQRVSTPVERNRASYELLATQKELAAAQSDLNRLEKFQETPIDDPNNPDALGLPDMSGDPEELVTVDFWNPQIIKDQVQGTKGVKYADVIKAVQRSTGGVFYIDENCKAKFVPPGYLATTELAIDITHLVTKQGLGKGAMSHANIVVVYGSGITEPGSSPVERERHKVVGYLQENVDSVHRHGTIQAAEVDVHYLPKQSQVEDLARNLIDYYKGDDDKADVEAIGICPLMYQKVKWRVPIGPMMDTEQCQFGSTAIMAVVSGRVTHIVLDYSAKGWTVEVQASTVEEIDTASQANFRALPPYAFTTKKIYDELVAQYSNLWNADNTNTEGVLTDSFAPGDGSHLWVKVVDGNHLELADPKSSFKDFAWGSIGSMASFPGVYALRWTDNQKLLQDGIIADLIAQSKA